MKHRAALLAFALLLGACQDEERCEKARLATATEWEKVRNEAGRFKFQGVAGYEEMNATQKTTHLDAFTAIEQQAQLVFESFAFKKISWTTGTRARDRAVKEFNGYFDKDKYVGFKGLLDSAQKRFSEAEAACR
ncbi:MAG: hypothetical protein HS104_05005 [Polyangiaceae bacterium]|nr:hypothetical protein [Polyangiaceae bacterium]MCL4753743.1 hypothetical protein [Myxococcales bacterium]